MADNRDTFVSEIYVNNEQANDAIGEMTKQLTKLTDKYDDLAAKNEKLAEKTAKAKAAMDETRKSLEGMAKDTEDYAKTSKKLKDQEKAYNDLAKKLEISKHKTDEAKKEMDSMSASIENAKKGVKLFGKAMEDLSGKSMENLKRMQSQLRSEMDKTKPNTKEWNTLAKTYGEVTNRIKTLESVQQQMVAKQGGFFSRMAKGLSDYYGAITLTIRAIRRGVAAFSSTYKTISSFEQANANLSTILGVNRDQMKDLEDAALKLGSTTRYTASEVTNLQTELAKLGFSQKEILDMGPEVLNFATAVGTDLASAASMAGVALRSFGLTSEETEDALGTMAVACNKSALSFSYLQSAFSTIAPVAKTYGLSLKDTIAMLGTLANSGFDASSAATATRNILLNLSDANGDLAKSLGGTVNTFDGIINGLVQLREQGVGLGKTLALTDKRSVAAFNTFLDGAESAKELRGALEDVNGELQRTADVRADTVEGAFAGLQSAWEGFILSFRNSSGTVKEMLKTLTDIVRKLPQYSDGIAKVTKSVLAVVLAIKAWTLAEKAKNAAVAAGNKLGAAVKVIVQGIRLAYFNVTGQTIKAAAAQTALNTAMAANPFGAVLAVVGLLTAAIIRLVGRQREAAEVTDYLAEAEKKANEEYGEQAGKVQALTAIVENNNISLAERKKALNELKKIVPGYHGDLTEEGRLINSNKEAIDEYCKSLREQIHLEARKEQLLEIERQIAALEDQKADAEERMHEALKKSGGNTAKTEKITREKYHRATGDYYTAVVGEKLTPYGQASKEAEEIQEQIENLEKQAEKVSKRIEKSFTDPIEKIKAEYEDMFAQIREESVDDPKAGNKEIERLRAERDQKIAEIQKTYATTSQVIAEGNASLTQAQFDFLQERYDKLTKKEKAMVDAGYAALSEEDSKALAARYAKMAKANTDQRNKLYQDQVKRLDQEQRKEQNDLNKLYFDREMTAEKHETKLSEIKVKYLMEKRSLAEKYGQDTTQIEQQLLTLEVEQRKRAYESELKLSERNRIEEESLLRQRLSANEITRAEFDQKMLESRERYLREQQELALKYKQDGSGIQLKDIEARQKEEEKALKRGLTSQEITQQQYDARMIEIRMKYLQQRLELARQNGQDETAILQSILDAQVEAENLAFEQMEKLKQDAKAVREGLDPKLALATGESDEMKKLQELHDAKLLSEEEYEKAVRGLHKRYAQANLEEDLKAAEQYTQKVSSIMSEASNFVNALKESESAKLEAEHQKQLTAAGDNAERREQIEADYEQKKLDLSKKYADAEMAISIAKTIANGAAAAVKAIADSGWIAGGIIAGLIAATTAAEVATIVAQRNAIKNSSINNSSSSGTSSVSTGERVVTGHYQGGFTEQGADDTEPAGIVHRNEWVAPAWMVRQNPVVFANLEEYRKERRFGKKNKAQPGFKGGGFTGDVPAADQQQALSPTNIRNIVYEAIRDSFKDNLIRAFVVRKDIRELDEQDDRFRSQVSL